MTPRNIEKYIEPIHTPFENLAARLVGVEEPQEDFIKVPKVYPRSPLRYPGGKSRAVKSLYSLIPETETRLCSPFLGGASFELACTTKMEVFGSDIFNPLVTFWQVLLSNQDELVKRVRKYYPLTRTKFYYLQKIYLTLTDEIEMAAVFFVLNRCSFSGTTLSGGMSPDHPRFTESAIERLQDFKADNFHVQQADYRDVIPLHRNDFLYLDPPYLNGEALYGDRGNTHKGFDHNELAELLVGRERWIMSYNDCTEIRTLYKKNQILSLDWVYGMSKDKKSSEVLILSRDLAA